MKITSTCEHPGATQQFQQLKQYSVQSVFAWAQRPPTVQSWTCIVTTNMEYTSVTNGTVST